MNHFLALKKPEKPMELSSPPVSPQGASFLTPRFLSSDTRTHQNERLIEKLTEENLELKSQIIDLNAALKFAEMNHKIELNNLKASYEINKNKVCERFSEAEFESKIIPLTQKCRNSILKALEIVSKRGDSEGESEFEEMSEGVKVVEEIQAGGRVNGRSESGEVVSIEVVRKKDKEIQKHRDFIKTLKSSLESILVEHKKSKVENEKHLQEIAELKAKLEKKP